MITATDLDHLRNTVMLAEQALDSGNSPFGSILVSEAGEVLFADYNRDASGDMTKHPEFAIARWAAANLEPYARAAATVYTSGEHCPMCAAAHAWAGLGRIVYVSSTEQLREWLAEADAPAPPVAGLSITEVAPGIAVDGPAPELTEQVHELQRRYHAG